MKRQTCSPHGRAIPYMATQPNTPETEIKVEDLLRLKRAERPDEAFWNQFDSELHQRMLSTLVKKDPWHIQVLRGLTGRIAQAGFVAAAAAALAVMVVVRPAIVGIEHESPAQLARTASALPAALVDGLPQSIDSAVLASAGATDYSIDSISAREASATGMYRQEFDLDRIEVAALDYAAYSADDAASSSFRSTATMASLAF